MNLNGAMTQQDKDSLDFAKAYELLQMMAHPMPTTSKFQQQRNGYQNECTSILDTSSTNEDILSTPDMCAHCLSQLIQQ